MKNVINYLFDNVVAVQAEIEMIYQNSYFLKKKKKD